MIQNALQVTKVGRLILGWPMTGHEQDLYGPAAWVVHHTVICHVLTGLPHPAIVADPVFAPSLVHSSRPGGFVFAAPRRELGLFSRNAARTQLEAMEDAYRAVLSGSSVYHDNNIGVMAVEHFMASGKSLAEFFQGFTLRGAPA
jgi:hypothetical protein